MRISVFEEVETQQESRAGWASWSCPEAQVRNLANP